MLHGCKPQKRHGRLLPISVGLLFACAACLIPTATASAATKAKRYPHTGGSLLAITTDTGVAHQIRITWSEGAQEYSISDGTVPMDADNGCHLESTYLVTCNRGSPPTTTITVDTGSLDDTVDVLTDHDETIEINTYAGNDSVVGTLGSDTIDGGFGNDTLLGDIAGGGGAADTITGGPGDDSISGGPGHDLLSGNDGNDTLIGGAGPDSMSGGAGTDRADYLDQVTPVTVTLDDLDNDGPAGEGDNVRTDVEDVFGGMGNDDLTGDGDANTLSGGDGDDVIRARDASTDNVLCGRGVDVAVADTLDAVESRCDTVDLPPGPRGGVDQSPTLKVTLASCGGKVKKAIACVQVRCQGALAICEGDLSLETLMTANSVKGRARRSKRSRGTTRTRVGSGTFSIATGSPVSVPVRLSRRAAKLLRRRGSLSVRATANAYDMAGAHATASANLKLSTRKRPPRR